MRSLSVESGDSQPFQQQEPHQQQHQQHQQQQQHLEPSQDPDPKETDLLLQLPPRVPVSAATSCPLEGSTAYFLTDIRKI
jgi:hypothetical protein